MQQIDHYLRQAAAAQELAKTATNATVREQFKTIADTWEQLARERRALIQLRTDVQASPERSRREPSSRCR